jgi:CRP-like cAMP-binding protein
MHMPYNHSSRSIQNQLLRQLPPEQLDRLIPHLEAVKLPPKKVLQTRGERVEFAYFPENSVVSFVVTLDDGGAVEVGMVGREGLAGIGILLGQQTAAHDAMVQIADTALPSALRISSENLGAAVVSDAKLQMHLLTYVHAFQFQIAQTAACNASHDVEQRCARWILTARDRIGRDEFALTHEFLAMMLSVRRAGVTMAAGLFEKAGFIENRRGQITIRDVDGLKEVSCECYRLIREEEERLLS